MWSMLSLRCWSKWTSVSRLFLVDAVADAFEVVDNAEHGAYALRAFVGEFVDGDMGEVVGYFHLHAVGDFLVFGNAGDGVVEFVVVLGGAEGGQEGEHAQDALGELFDFLLSGLQVELGGVHPVARDIFEFEYVLLVFGFFWDHPVDDFDDGRDEEGQDEGVDDVEEGVEEGERHGDGLRVVAAAGDGVVGVGAHHADGDAGDDAEHRAVENECEDDTNEVEDEVGAGGFLTIGVGHHGGEVGGDGGADVLSHDEGDGGIEANPAVVAHDEGDGHHGGRGLDKAGEECADEDEKEYGPEAEAGEGGEGLEEVGIFFKVGHGLLEETHADEEKGETHDEFADGFEAVPLEKHEY